MTLKPTFLIVVLLMLVAIVAANTSVARDITLLDLLTMEGIGHVEFGPTGRRIVFERIPAYTDGVNYGVGIDESRYSGELYVDDLGHGSPPQPLLNRMQLPFDGMWMAGFSPKGSRLAVFWLQDGAAHMGAFDFSTNTLVRFPFTPDFGFPTPHGVLEPVWVSEDELVMAAEPAGRQPIVTGMRQAGARSLAEEWEKAFQGKEATASVLRSYAGVPPHIAQGGSLLRINARNGKAEMLGEGRYLDLSLAPSGRYLAAARIGERRQYEPDKPLNGNSGLVGFYRHEAVMFDLKAKAIPVPLCVGYDVADSSFAWGSDGKSLAFFAWREGTERRNGTFQLVDDVQHHCRAMPHIGLDLPMENFRVAPLQALPFEGGLALPARASINPSSAPSFTDDPDDPTRIDWYWLRSNGTSKNLTSNFKEVSPNWVAANQRALYLKADGGLARVSIRDKSIVLTSGVTNEIATAQRIRDSIVVESDGQPGTAQIVDIASGKVRRQIDWNEPGRVAAISPESGAIILRRDRGADWRLTSVLAGSASKDFWKYNGHLADVQMPRRVVLKYTLADGTDLAASAFLPNSLSPGRRAPVIVDVYPGGTVSKAEWEWLAPYSVQLFTSLGYIVLLPDAPEKLLRSSDNNPLGRWAEVVMPAVQSLIREGYGDPDRLAAHGVSQGSWSVLALISQTRQFKAAIAGFGGSDLISEYGTLVMAERLWPDDSLIVGDAYRFESTQGYTYPSVGGTPWDNTPGYIRASPLFAVKEMVTPLLLFKSDFDIVGGMEQFDQMFSSLLRLRKEAQYVRYWGEGHLPSSPANIRDQWSRELAWFDQYLEISRDSSGRIIYDENTPKSRGTSPAWTPDDFLKLTWFFGPPTVQAKGIPIKSDAASIQ